MNPERRGPWSLTNLREKLIKIAARRSSAMTAMSFFQMAEVAMSRQMFAEILALIARLWAAPALAWAARRSDATDHDA